MKKRSPMVWLIPLIILLLIIPFIVPSALPGAYAAGKKKTKPKAKTKTVKLKMEDLSTVDLPEYEPVILANLNPGEVPTEEVAWGKRGATRQRPLFGPHFNALLTNEDGKNRGYLDGTISVRIEETVIKNTKVFFTWIKIADPSQLRAQFANPYPGTAEIDADKLSKRENAILTINGDSCVHIKAGTVIRNGEIFREKEAKRYHQLIVDKKGDFHILKNPTAEDLETWKGNILHSFVFGPALVIDGEKQDIGEQRDYGSGITFKKNAQRQILCQVEPLSYLIVTTEGPEQSEGGGFTLYEMTDLVYEMGVQTAYNLDGGCTTWLVLENERINNPQRRSARGITDIIYFVTAEEDPEPNPEPTEEAGKKP